MVAQPRTPFAPATRLAVGEPVTRQVLRELRRAIVTLELAPGMKLSETEIAQRYGVSRQPVREALISLAASRLVEIQPQRGTVVVKISAKQMLDARFVREAIEVAVVRRACLGFDRAVRAEIDRILAVQRQAVEMEDQEAFHLSDEAFHRALADGAGCPLAWHAIEDFKIHMDRVCRLTLRNPRSLPTLLDQHGEIVRAIDAQDADGASLAMQQHLTEILRTLPIVERQYPALFEPRVDPAAW